MGLRPRAFLAGSLGFVVAFVVACGGSTGLLSGPQADSLNSKLNAISSAVGAGRCGSAVGAAQAFQSQVAALPSTVNSTLANNLDQGASTLSELANRDCSSSSSTHSTTATSTSKSSTSPTSTSISTTTVTNSSTPTSSTNSNTATNPGGTGTSSTSNGGAGIGQTTGGGGN